MNALGMMCIATVVVPMLAGCRVYHPLHSGIYRGTVLDSDTGQPLAGARIKLTGLFYMSTAGISTSSKSAQDGRFVIGPVQCSHLGPLNPPPYYIGPCDHNVGGEFTLALSKAGYQQLDLRVPAFCERTNPAVVGELCVGTVRLHPRAGASE